MLFSCCSHRIPEESLYQTGIIRQRKSCLESHKSEDQELPILSLNPCNSSKGTVPKAQVRCVVYPRGVGWEEAMGAASRWFLKVAKALLEDLPILPVSFLSMLLNPGNSSWPWWRPWAAAGTGAGATGQRVPLISVGASAELFLLPWNTTCCSSAQIKGKENYSFLSSLSLFSLKMDWAALAFVTS